jgi:hypothetical protein
MPVIAIDPGTNVTGFVVMEEKEIATFGVVDNDEMLKLLSKDFRFCDSMAYEMIASYGMPVGAEVFSTCVWIGRFIQVFGHEKSHPVFRKDVKMHLCGTTKAKDGNIRQAIIDMYEGIGGGKIKQIGTKKQPGPLYGVTTHIWPAIGVGMTFQGVCN